jgi:L,D-transpeptidase ErfK/SrfK
MLWAAGAAAGPLILSHKLSGSRFQYIVHKGDSFASIGSRYGVDAAVLAFDNGLESRSRLARESTLWVDDRHIVPADIQDGILINLPQRMLFLLAGGNPAAAYPVAVGKPTWRTPRGDFTVVEMRKDPVWRVPKSIQAEMAAQGKRVRTRVPPGPRNPLGKYWIGLSLSAIGIHGTIVPRSIYHFRTHGCIRLNADDVATLFGMVDIGTPGAVVYHPVMLAQLDDGRIFVEANPDAYDLEGDPLQELRALADSSKLGNMIDWQRVKEALEYEDGLAREVTVGRESQWHDSPLVVVKPGHPPGVVEEEHSAAGNCSG